MSKYLSIIVVVLLLLPACTPERTEVGVIGRINDRPIYMRQLEFQHDLAHMGDIGGGIPSVEALRVEYGRLFGELIVQELILAELELRNLDVTEEEIKEIEAQVRDDYPNQEIFEQVLVEEYIDLKSWRELLKYHRALSKFYQKVLRPEIKITYTEAEQYYADHAKEFFLPERLKLVSIKGPSKKIVEQARAMYRDGEEVNTIATTLNGVAVKQEVVRRERLPKPWREALADTPSGDFTKVFADRNAYESLFLVEKEPARILDPSQAYPLIEEALLETKLHQAFEEWLKAKLATASIEISPLLKANPQMMDGDSDENGNNGEGTDVEATSEPVGESS
ncbi:MAG: peptidyl-prolyl cis-trans isomerase [Desulfovibrio sp.]